MSNRAPARSLADLADQANEYHRRAETAAKTAIEYAIEAGKLLIEAKELVRHGGWLPWLEENASFSRTTAANYMRIARADVQHVAHLTVRDALKELAEPKQSEDDDHDVDHDDEAAEQATKDDKIAAFSELIAASDEPIAANEEAIAEAKAIIDAAEADQIDDHDDEGATSKEIIPDLDEADEPTDWARTITLNTKQAEDLQAHYTRHTEEIPATEELIDLLEDFHCALESLADDVRSTIDDRKDALEEEEGNAA